MKQTRFFEIYEAKKGNRTVLLTKNLTPGKTVYDEEILKEGKTEYRTWNPLKSKLAAAIVKGLNQTGLRQGNKVLYLGAASGTTVSHISDIVGKEGQIFALDFAPRVVRDLVFVCEERENLAPILADANKPEEYKEFVDEVDVVYQDIAQRNQLEIFLKNCKLFLKKGGFGLLALKARSIDVAKKPRQIFNETKERLINEMTLVDYRELDPFEKDHAFFVVKKR